MKNKTKILSFIIITVGVCFSFIAKANPIPEGQISEASSFFISFFDVIPHLFMMVTLALLIEVPLGFLLLFRDSKSFFAGCLINLISYPIFFVVYFSLGHIIEGILMLYILFVLELLVVLFEAWFYRKYFKNIISWKKSLFVSFVLNFVSFFVGLIITRS